ncbi:Os04g0503550 [Oryza sativa Japonica Group]|uniref:Os04g0503550 protein n=1 Tax=Oryza sativa subsp. japonica TaxID=39947 RepID=A0A0P0WC49_ORYSJ|nr:hypothetical protein EE612_024252 [Oryza sativa]BAS89954.1 Os04g0503550 [Oryza sativa Japonica Group]
MIALEKPLLPSKHPSPQGSLPNRSLHLQCTITKSSKQLFSENVPLHQFIKYLLTKISRQQREIRILPNILKSPLIKAPLAMGTAQALVPAPSCVHQSRCGARCAVAT